MPRRTLVLPALLAGIAFTVAACSDREGHTPAGPETVTVHANNSSDCNLGDIPRAVRSYFGNSSEAKDLLKDLRDACAADDAERIASLSWDFLALVETALGAGSAGDPADGAHLVNRLIDCIENSTCDTDASNDIAVQAALSHGGLFGVRGSDDTPVPARDPIGFTDFESRANQALFGLETILMWDYVTGTPRVLFYGSPVVADGLDLLEVGFGGLQYDFDRYPVPPVGTPGNPFEDDGLKVSVCFEHEVTLPHLGGDESRPTLQPLLQREAVVLEKHTPALCAGAFPQLQAASLWGAAVGMLRAFLPFTDLKAPSLGGTPLEFSRFAPVAVDPEGTLEFLSVPMDRVVEGESIGEIRVQARSGAGTPLEKVLVTLSIRDNRGVPAGAVLSGDTESLTREADGVAVFPDGDGEPVSVGKPGGYILCANGSLDGFAFEEVCTERFHIQNDTQG